ncbi:Cytochrome b2 [Penicillium rolfsii]|nr:Cytochrome b2 [Penicillium rolfsii]
MFNDITQPPPPLPTTQSTEIRPGLSIVLPLSRRGHGPGLIVLVPDTEQPLAIIDGIPSQSVKWAEEGYTVAAIQRRALMTGAREVLTEATQALQSCEKCDPKDQVGLIAYDPELWNYVAPALEHVPRIVGAVVYSNESDHSTLVPADIPVLLHMAGKKPTSAKKQDLVKCFYYPNAKSHRFASPFQDQFDYWAESVSHTRTLQFLKPIMNGPFFDLETIWEEHTYYEFADRSVEHTMSTMVDQPYVNHIPTLTGGNGRDSLTNFYRHNFIFNNSDDTDLELVSRTLGIDRVVDEFIFKFTHDKELDWLLPGVPPTNKHVEVPFTAVVNIRGDRLYHEHISWDQGSVLRQVGLMPEYLPYPYNLPDGSKPAPGKQFEYRVPVAGIDSAEKMRDRNSIASNQMFKFSLREVPEKADTTFQDIYPIIQIFVKLQFENTAAIAIYRQAIVPAQRNCGANPMRFRYGTRSTPHGLKFAPRASKGKVPHFRSGAAHLLDNNRPKSNKDSKSKAAMAKKVSTQEISHHASEEDAWIVVNGKVYDVTEFAPNHPGGADIIYQFAGRDASKPYNSTHSLSLIKELDDHVIGELDTSTITEEWSREETVEQKSFYSTDGAYRKPALEDIINLDDFEHVAMNTLSPKSWAYNSGAANDNFTRDANRSFFRDIWFRPAIMRNVSSVNLKSTLFNCDLDIPVYISPVGAAKTVHEEGELELARGAAKSGIPYCLSTMSSYSLSEILDVTSKPVFYQLYINKDRPKTEALIRLAQESGKVKAFFVTADLPVMSKREADERIKPEGNTVLVNVTQGSKNAGKKSSGLAKSNSSLIDSTLSWKDLKWLRSITNIPILVKGVQRAEDALLAAQAGFDGIVISNHGGRAADTAPPAILILLEIHRYCPEIFGKIKVLVDGGFRRGSDVVKAICLGASAVGLGRPFQYALGYGQEGVAHAVELLKEEIQTSTQLVGMTDLMRDASPTYLNTAGVEHLLPPNYASSQKGFLRRLIKL